MDFYEILTELEDDTGRAYIPYSYKTEDGKWHEGTISIDFLNEHFSQYETADEMTAATESEGLKLYFTWLRDQGLLN